MKKIRLIVLLALFMPFISQAGSHYHDCSKKIISLEQQLRYASFHGNKHKVFKIKKKIDKLYDKCYDSHSGATKINGYYPKSKATDLERELDSLRRVIEALNDLK